jgi:hypothetical protein
MSYSGVFQIDISSPSFVHPLVSRSSSSRSSLLPPLAHFDSFQVVALGPRPLARSLARSHPAAVHTHLPCTLQLLQLRCSNPNAPFANVRPIDKLPSASRHARLRRSHPPMGRRPRCSLSSTHSIPLVLPRRAEECLLRRQRQRLRLRLFLQRRR